MQTCNWVNGVIALWCQHQNDFLSVDFSHLWVSRSVPLLATAISGKEDIHLDEDLQNDKNPIDSEEGHSHPLGKAIATEAEDYEKCHRGDDQDQNIVLYALGANLLGLPSSVVDTVLDEPRHSQGQQDGQRIGTQGI